MAAPIPWHHDPRARRAQMWISTFFILLGLAAATGARYAYQHAVQAPLCYEYARKQQLADVDQLRFREAGIAGRRREHDCVFHHAQRDVPVVLRFDDADVPRGLDAGEIAAMIGAFLLFSGIGVWWWECWLKRNGFTLPGGFRPADPAA